MKLENLANFETTNNNYVRLRIMHGVDNGRGQMWWLAACLGKGANVVGGAHWYRKQVARVLPALSESESIDQVCTPEEGWQGGSVAESEEDPPF